MRLDQSTRYGETKSSASRDTLVAPPRAFAAVEPIEDPLELIRGDARTAIADADLDRVIVRAGADFDRPTRRRMAQRIVQEIA